jgi:anti-anti-sigma factor
LPPRDVLWHLIITVDTIDEVAVLAPSGRVSHATCDLLDKALDEAITAMRAVIVDLAGVDYISSAGLHALARAASRLQMQGAELVLCGLQETVRPAFELAGPIRHLAVEADRDAALRRAAAGTPRVAS